jgi:hypothetical protein
MVRMVAVPEDVAGLAGLATADYQEAFEFASDSGLRPEQWARLILEGASRRERLSMLGTWVALGVGLAPPGSAGQVLGWRIRRSDQEAVVLGVRALVGLTARIVIRVDGGQVVHAMVVRYDRRLGGRLWALAAPKHRSFLAGLLQRAAQGGAVR